MSREDCISHFGQKWLGTLLLKERESNKINIQQSLRWWKSMMLLLLYRNTHKRKESLEQHLYEHFIFFLNNIRLIQIVSYLYPSILLEPSYWYFSSIFFVAAFCSFLISICLSSLAFAFSSHYLHFLPSICIDSSYDIVSCFLLVWWTEWSFNSPRSMRNPDRDLWQADQILQCLSYRSPWSIFRKCLL